MRQSWERSGPGPGLQVVKLRHMEGKTSPSPFPAGGEPGSTRVPYLRDQSPPLKTAFWGSKVPQATHFQERRRLQPRTGPSQLHLRAPALRPLREAHTGPQRHVKHADGQTHTTRTQSTRARGTTRTTRLPGELRRHQHHGFSFFQPPACALDDFHSSSLCPRKRPTRQPASQTEE